MGDTTYSFDSAKATVREALTKAAALSSNATLIELTGLGDPTEPRARAVVKAALGADDPTEDLASLVAVAMKLLDEVQNLLSTMQRTAIPGLTDSIVRHTVVAVRSLQRALEPPAPAEQPQRIMFTQRLAESILALAKHVETLQKIPT
jgi:hypothetical protein